MAEIRVRWPKNRYSEYMANWEEGHWTFWDREYAGVIWYPVGATSELCKTANSLLTAEQRNEMREAAEAQANGTKAGSDHQDELALAVAA